MSAHKRERLGHESRLIRILLVDDHPLTRAGLAEVLHRETDFLVCGEAQDRQGALEAIPTLRPNLAIVDLALKDSDGLELIKDMRSRFPEVRILVVSMLDELLHAERALRAGASGYITKEEAPAKVVQAVRQLLRDKPFVSQHVAGQMAARAVGRPQSGALPALDTLSDRELQVFRLIGDGLSRQQIAERLHLDINTVETYRARIKEKLQLKDALELLQYAIRAGRGSRPSM